MLARLPGALIVGDDPLPERLARHVHDDRDDEEYDLEQVEDDLCTQMQCPGRMKDLSDNWNVEESVSSPFRGRHQRGADEEVRDDVDRYPNKLNRSNHGRPCMGWMTFGGISLRHTQRQEVQPNGAGVNDFDNENVWSFAQIGGIREWPQNSVSRGTRIARVSHVRRGRLLRWLRLLRMSTTYYNARMDYNVRL